MTALIVTGLVSLVLGTCTASASVVNERKICHQKIVAVNAGMVPHRAHDSLIAVSRSSLGSLGTTVGLQTINLGSGRKTATGYFFATTALLDC